MVIKRTAIKRVIQFRRPALILMSVRKVYLLRIHGFIILLIQVSYNSTLKSTINLKYHLRYP